jgi:hypothetical protein
MVTFGEEYAAAAAPALAILALTFVATVIRQLFVAVSRVQGRTRRATGYAVFAGVVELIAAWYGASHGGLTTLATYLAVGFLLEGALMAPPVLRAAFARPSDSGAESAAAAAAPAASTGPTHRGPGRHVVAGTAQRDRRAAAAADVPAPRRRASEAPTVQFRMDEEFRRSPDRRP